MILASFFEVFISIILLFLTLAVLFLTHTLRMHLQDHSKLHRKEHGWD